MTDEYKIDNVTWAEKDGNGDIVVKPDLVNTEQARITELSAVLEKTTNQSISADTDTTVDWDSQDVDTNLYTYNSTSDEIDVLEPGDYAVDYFTGWSASSGDRLFIKAFVNGTEEKRRGYEATGTDDDFGFGFTFKDLASNDTIRFDVRTTASNDLAGSDLRTFASITRSG
jgi:hypothetical protein